MCTVSIRNLKGIKILDSKLLNHVHINFRLVIFYVPISFRKGYNILVKWHQHNSKYLLCQR